MSEPTPPSGGKTNPLTRKIGPLPTWGWVAIIGGGIVAYELYKSRSSNASTTGTATPASDVPQFVNQTFVNPGPPSAPHGRDNDKDDRTRSGKGGIPGVPGGGRDQGKREVATGSETLAEIARKAGVTVAFIVATTENSKIDAANLKKFKAAAAHPNRKLPKGTVYYLPASTVAL